MGLVRETLRNIIAWAVVESDGSAGGSVPVQQIRAFDQSGRSVEWYPYGFFASARAGARALRFKLSENADAIAHMPGSPDEAPAHKAGEVGVYHPDSGSFVIFREDGSVEVSAKADVRATAGGTVIVEAAGAVAVTSAVSATVTAPAIVADGPLTVTGNLDQDGALIGFRGSAPVAKPIINGTKTGGTAQNQLLAALELMGIIDDQT